MKKSIIFINSSIVTLKVKLFFVLIIFFAVFLVNSVQACLQPYIITPSKNVTQNQLFSFESGVKCVCGECGNVSVTLDPSVVFSESFIYGQTASAQCTAWNTFRGQIDSDTIYTKITISGSNAGTGVSCTGPTANTICQALNTLAEGIWMCDGHNWSLCNRYTGELWLDPPSLCSGANCPNPGYIIRPCISYSCCWGGVNTSACNGPNQIMTVVCGVESTKGAISTRVGDNPFYTINQNPQICSNLLENQTCNKTWQVNATGEMGKKWEFFTIYNSTLSGSSQTGKVNITISCVDNDNDGICNDVDNCISINNTNQNDTDKDGVGNACDNCMNVNNTNQTDTDNDSIGNACDNCPYTYNPDQNDTDGDGYGDACECLQPYLITSSISVSQDQFFNFSSGVRCVCNECGNISATLDPVNVKTIFEDDFSTDRGWIGYGGSAEWERGSAITSSGCSGNQDPSFDHTPTPDNFVVGNDIGGCYDSNIPSAFYLTSPIIDASLYTNVQFSYWRYCGVESPTYDHLSIDVFNGTQWINIFSNTGSYSDSSWVFQAYNVSKYADGNPNFRIRFGLGQTDGTVNYMGWNIDDVSINGTIRGKGVIPMNNGTPFYTINNNPQTCFNMYANQTCNKTWLVNATGEMGKKWEFFTIYNSTLSGSSQTGKVNITISCVDNDNDGICNDVDNCISINNTNQNDTDKDGVGNACDNCMNVNNTNQTDTDNDSIGNACDNCPYTYNPDQNDTDGDGYGDACECLQPYTITQSKNVTQNQLFSFESGVKCVCGECGNVSATLDPAFCNGGCVDILVNSKHISMDRIPRTDYHTYSSARQNCLSLGGDMANFDESYQWAYWHNSSSFDIPYYSYEDSAFCDSHPASGSGYITCCGKAVVHGYGWHDLYGCTCHYCPSNDNLSFNPSGSDMGYVCVFRDKGVIPMNNGTPFYTINNNPQTCFNIYANQTCNKTWLVNATGEMGKKWEFFTIYNSSVSGIAPSNKVNITIRYNNPPLINQIQCYNGSVWTNCSNIKYYNNITKVKVNCTDIDGPVVSAKFKLVNVPDNFTFFDNGSTINDNGLWILDNPDVNIQDSGNWILYVSCTDNESAEGIGSVEWLVPWGQLEPYLIDPADNKNVSQYNFFNFKSGVKCIRGECGDVSVILDPQKIITYKPSNEILLKSGRFVPDDLRLQKGVDILVLEKTTYLKEREHIVIQFDEVLSSREKRELEKKGIKFLMYVPNKAWLVSRSADKTLDIPNARWYGKLGKNDKISSNLLTDNIGEWSINPDGDLTLLVQFYPDVAIEKAKEIIMFHNGKSGNIISSINTLVVKIPKSEMDALAYEDEVMWVGEFPPPLTPVNDEARQITGAEELQEPPYGLDGSDITVYVYDGGIVESTHGDLTGRVTLAEGGSVESHATHVACTVGGTGTRSQNFGGTLFQWRGMAPNITIISGEYDSCTPYCLYNSSNDIEGDYNYSIHTYNVDIATNSIGSNVAPNDYPCSWEGDYELTCQLVDGIIKGSLGKPLPSIWANGNERGDGTCGTGYSTTAPPATMKNSVSVGATDKNDTISSYTSFGPTDDGRLKPDVTAPGTNLYSCTTGNKYTTMSGTSMATPTTTGNVALMMQSYRQNHDNVMLPSTVKAMLIHTAKDLGNPGPDYKFGYGRINSTASVSVIRQDGVNNKLIFEGNISDHGDSQDFFVSVQDGANQFKITLVWTDYPGSPLVQKELVNDIDLIVVSPNGTRFYPWTLDSSNPGLNAVRNQEDHVNNVEQVLVDNPISGLWSITVSGIVVPMTPQDFSLVSDYKLYMGKGNIPMYEGTPFYTIDQNPVYPDNQSCLQGMKNGDSCNQTWQVNATGETGKTWKFFAVYQSAYDQTKNQTTTTYINVTIVNCSFECNFSVLNMTYSINPLTPGENRTAYFKLNNTCRGSLAAKFIVNGELKSVKNITVNSSETNLQFNWNIPSPGVYYTKTEVEHCGSNRSLIRAIAVIENIPDLSIGNISYSNNIVNATVLFSNISNKAEMKILSDKKDVTIGDKIIWRMHFGNTGNTYKFVKNITDFFPKGLMYVGGYSFFKSSEIYNFSDPIRNGTYLNSEFDLFNPKNIEPKLGGSAREGYTLFWDLSMCNNTMILPGEVLVLTYKTIVGLRIDSQSTNNIFFGSDTGLNTEVQLLVDGILNQTKCIARCSNGTEYACFNLTIGGNHNITIKIDPGNQIKETNETNNMKSISIYVP